MEQTKNTGRFLAGVIFLIGFLLGIETGGLQFVLLKAAKEFHLSQTAMGSIVTIQFIAVTIAPLVMGRISDQIGKKKVIAGASLLFACGSAISILSLNMSALLAGVLLIGFAFGSLETTITAALSDAFCEKSGKYISMMQGCLSFGAVLSPLLLDFFINRRDMDWRVLFLLCLLFSIAGGIAVCFAKFNEGREKDEERPGRLGLRDIVLIGAFLLIAVYMIMENNTTCFIDSFFAEVLGSGEYSAIALSCFWAAMTLSRWLFSLLYQKRNVILPAVCTAAAGLLISMNWMSGPAATIFVLFAIGFCYGPISPFVMNLAVERYPEKSGTIAGLMLGFMGAGGAAGPVLGGYIADLAGLRVNYICTGILAAAGAVIFVKMIAGAERRPLKSKGKE